MNLLYSVTPGSSPVYLTVSTKLFNCIFQNKDVNLCCQPGPADSDLLRTSYSSEKCKVADFYLKTRDLGGKFSDFSGEKNMSLQKDGKDWSFITANMRLFSRRQRQTLIR